MPPNASAAGSSPPAPGLHTPAPPLGLAWASPEALPLGLRLALFGAATAACAAYLGALTPASSSSSGTGKASSARAGPRLVAALPVLLLNCTAPLAFPAETEILTKAFVTFVTVWLSNFKVLSWCLGRGPLCQGLNGLQRFLILLLPITPVRAEGDGCPSKGPQAPSPRRGNSRLGEARGHFGELAGGFLAKAAFLGAAVTLLSRVELPQALREFLYAVGLYCFLGCLNDGPAALLGAVTGLRLSPHFDCPFLSTSLVDFWSRRWNLTAGFTLRCLVYDPIVEGRLVVAGPQGAPPPPPGKLRRAAGVCAAFIASGLVHEATLWYLGGRVSGHWLAFFAAQGPLCSAESEVKAWARRRGLALPPWLSCPLALAFLQLLAHLLFFPPCDATGLTGRVIGNLHAGYGRLAGSLGSAQRLLALVGPAKAEL